MSTRPAAVLFDADGVLQHSPPAWRALVARTGPGFLPRLLEREEPFLDGRQTDWRPTLEAFLADEGGSITADEFLEAWLAFRPDPACLDVVREVRAAGVRTVLATNQQAVRAAAMHDEGRYDDVMDVQFFSYRVGALKPDARYFEHVVAALGLRPGEALFVDDVPANVEGALAVGLRARHLPPDAGAARLRALLVDEGVLDPTISEEDR